MINYERNLFAILTIYLMRMIATTNSYHFMRMVQPQATVLKPFWKFSSFVRDNIQYQCYQKCIPNIASEHVSMVELCNKICPFQPGTPECAKCPQIWALLTAPPDLDATIGVTQPEAIVIEPVTHMIMYKPEIVMHGAGGKQCCYLDQCEIVPLDAVCDARCYEPCDQVCTGRCFMNPHCPNQCEIIRQEQFRIKYKIWLVQKLNEIKQKYRAMATACLLRTRLAFVSEVQSLNDAAQHVLVENGPLLPHIQDEVENININDYKDQNLNLQQTIQQAVAQPLENDSEFIDPELYPK